MYVNIPRWSKAGRGYIIPARVLWVGFIETLKDLFGRGFER
jgi:hypothetical protein